MSPQAVDKSACRRCKTAPESSRPFRSLRFWRGFAPRPASFVGTLTVVLLYLCLQFDAAIFNGSVLSGKAKVDNTLFLCQDIRDHGIKILAHHLIIDDLEVERLRCGLEGHVALAEEVFVQQLAII